MTYKQTLTGFLSCSITPATTKHALGNRGTGRREHRHRSTLKRGGARPPQPRPLHRRARPVYWESPAAPSVLKVQWNARRLRKSSIASVRRPHHMKDGSVKRITQKLIRHYRSDKLELKQHTDNDNACVVQLQFRIRNVNDEFNEKDQKEIFL